jgi:hypothetical protein
MDFSPSKDTLLRKADTLLGEARRARKSASVATDGERAHLMERAEDLERQAARLEKDAVSAKSGVFGAPSQQAAAKHAGLSRATTSGIRTLVRAATDEEPRR